MYNIIFNPVAGKKKAFENLDVVKRIMDECKVEYNIYKSGGIHDAEYIARDLTQKGETSLIVLGGDGTLNEVLNGLVDPSVCTLGLVPSGTGNDFAERMGIPLDPEQAIRRIMANDAKPVDYIDVSGTRSMNVAGLGMDVDVLERCQRGNMKGKLKYLLSLVQSLFSFKGYRVHIEAEGVSEDRDVLLCAVCNGSQFGGGIRICPAADPADGKLDVVTVDCIGGKLAIIKAFMELLKGKILEYPLTKHYLVEKVTFTPKQDCPIQLDGELYQHHAFEAEVKKGLKFY
ncbi:MAG: diacylglycerol kinase family lipid kinase [Clostridia bacterium]|nr:diacylglycerol kinase family lipid kinase [Clostridia bacterium]